MGLQRFLLLALFGLIAQLIDGALGMAYGLTSTTLLLAAGLAPAVASASVHLAEVGTTLASGAAHWKLGNTDWKAVRWLALPGGVGAFAGATVLSNLDGDAARPWISLFLVVLGVYVVVRFAFLGGRIEVRDGVAATAAAGTSRARGRFPRCYRWRWLGTAGDANHARLRPHGATEGHRYGIDERVRGGPLCQPRLPGLARFLGLRPARGPGAARWWGHRGPHRG